MMKKNQKNSAAVAACPCGSGLALAQCCGQYLAGAAAPDAERLMRSRYSAYVLGLEAYLLATWHASTRPASLDLSADTALKWSGLQVLHHAATGARAEVEFIARYKINGRAGCMHELSCFVHEEGRWFYVDGTMLGEA